MADYKYFGKFKPSDIVVIDSGASARAGITAVVTGVLFRGTGLVPQYECEWFADGGTPQARWIEETRLRLKDE